MSFVDRKPIQANFGRVAALLDLTFGSVVALLAQRLQFAEPKRVPISTVRLDMIDDGRWDDESMVVQTHRAERVQR